MADQFVANIPTLAGQISTEYPQIEQTLGWYQQVLAMLCGWDASTLANIPPPVGQRSEFLWKDGDEIYIEPGVYFHDGTTRQMVFWDAQLTFALQAAGSNADSDNYGADGWHYIFLDDTAIVTKGGPELDNTCFLNKTTAPTWSDAKHGWYTGSDRCIFACYETGGAILEFYHMGDLVTFADTQNNQAQADIDTWTDVTLTAPAFVRKALVYFQAAASGQATTWYYRTNGQTGTTGLIIAEVTAAAASFICNTIPVITDASQIIEVQPAVSGVSTIKVDTSGWYFPIGL
jgi:hypothetical protein